jgi:leucyl aminopeptidase
MEPLMKITFTKEAKNIDVAIVVGVFEDKEMTPPAQFLDETTNGLISAALDKNHFKGKVGEVLSIIAPNDLKVRRILLVGFGKKDKLSEKSLQEIGGYIYKALAHTPDKEAVVHLDTLSTPAFNTAAMAANIAYGALLKSWRFDKYKTKEKPEDKPSLDAFTVLTEESEAAQKAFAPLEATAKGVMLCRELASEPANILNPITYANRIKDELKPLGVEVEVLDVPAMSKLGMGSLLGVAQGSVNEPRVVVMQYKGGAKDAQPLAFVGKGVTFDSGGISIKPAQGMEEMKYDMCGSGAVVGLLKALALRKAKVNAVGVVGLVENMPSGTAQRPGDIVTSMSGQTIQVENTDAEGRLVLCDALWYTQERFKPKLMIDLATLTGAVVIALGDVYAGLYSNNEELGARMLECGEKTGDLMWRMPLADAYDKQLNIDCADMNNIGGRKAGSVTAAQFLKRFVNDVPWAHCDIAGTAYLDKDTALANKGPTGAGISMLDRLVKDYYEA